MDHFLLFFSEDSGEAGVAGVAVSLSAASDCFSGVLSTPFVKFSLASLVSYNTTRLILSLSS